MAIRLNDDKRLTEFVLQVARGHSLKFGMDHLLVRWHHPQIDDSSAGGSYKNEIAEVTIARYKKPALFTCRPKHFSVRRPR